MNIVVAAMKEECSISGNNAKFIAAARAALPELLNALEAMTKDRDKWKALFDRLTEAKRTEGSVEQ